MIIVTGLEHAGTRELMKILRQGGCKTVNISTRDLMNKKVCMDNYLDCVLEVVSIGVTYLPVGFDYKLIYMNRGTMSIVQEMSKEDGMHVSASIIKAENRELREFVEDNFRTIVVNYEDLTKDWSHELKKIKRHIGTLDIEGAEKEAESLFTVEKDDE